MPSPLRLSGLLLGCVSLAPASAQVAPATIAAPRTTVPDNARFAAFADRVVDQWLALDPVGATQLGEHRHDGKYPDVSAAGRAARRALYRRQLAELARFDQRSLSRQQQVDAILLKEQLDYQLFALDTLSDWAWDPVAYSGIAGSGLYSLSSREFAPLPERLRSATLRLEALPAFLAQVRGTLIPARVPKVHAETAASQNKGLHGLIEGILASSTELPAAERARLQRAAAAAQAAVDQHQKWLDTTLVPAARGNERLGPALYDAKLRLALATPLSRADIRRRAEAEIVSLRARMYQVAATLLSGRPGAPPAPASPTPAQQQAVIAAGLAIVTADAPPRDGVIAFARETQDQALAFAKATGQFSFPEMSFNIIEMPEYQRGFAVAYADMPGPFERDQRGFYAVMPLPGAWSEEQKASWLREYNKWSLHELTIHESVPGHLFQLGHANRFRSSRLRAFFQSGPMVEGWACYSQDVMADAGYLDRDPRYLLAHYKFQMRLPVNALLDQGFHVDGMTRDQAMTLMTEAAFQEEREAAGKWTRMQLSSAQLPVYFVGYQEWKDLRAEAERRPGFTPRAFHDAALAHGSPPVRFIRQLLLNEAIR